MKTKYIGSQCFDALNNSNDDDDNNGDDNNNKKDKCKEAKHGKQYDVVDNKKLITKCFDLGEGIREPIISDNKGIKNIDSVSELKDFDSKN